MSVQSVQNFELVEARRRQIVDAAFQLFQRNGYGGTSVKDISDASGIPVGTLYRYIKTKSDVLFLLAQQVNQTLAGPVVRALDIPGSESERLEAGIHAYLITAGKLRREFKIFYWDTHWLPPEEQQAVISQEHDIMRLFERAVERGVASTEFRAVDPHIVAMNIVLLGHAWALKSHWLAPSFDLDAYVRVQSELLLRSIRRDHRST